jgi:predicted amidohydrolase
VTITLPALLAQFPVSHSIADNLGNILSLLDYTQAGDLVLFPEGAVSGYAQDLTFIKDIDPKVLNATLDELRDQAHKRGIHLWVGTLIPEGREWYNAAFGFTPNGGAFQYRKINLAHHERGTITPGSDLPVFDLEMEDGIVKVGVQICREVRYPEQWGWLSRKGAKVYLHLNNATNNPKQLSVWRSHLVSHAACNQRYMLSANNASPAQSSPTIAISPEGWVLDEIVSDRPAYMRVELDLSRVSDGYLEQSRPDVVSITVPGEKERRKILRSMKMEKLQSELDELQANQDLYQESNLTARMEALDFIDLIEDMHRVRSRDRDLHRLHQQAHDLRQRLERINARMFTRLRQKIQHESTTPVQLRACFNAYTDYDPTNRGQPHYGYENLDGLISGVFLSKPAPQETRERQPGMIRYQPTPASVILELTDQVEFSSQDVFYDLGSGLGQVVGLVNLLTGVRCVGIEYQTTYCAYAREMASSLGLKNTSFINADAKDVDYSNGTIFFMFNPFGGRIFDDVMGKLHEQAQQRRITICSYGPSTSPLVAFPWLEAQDESTIHDFKLAVFRSKADRTRKNSV